jgi:putative acetyltransferase
MLIRLEQEKDRDAVHAVNTAAFGGSAEADLVDTLRDLTLPVISIVAEDEGDVVGHIMFVPVSLSGHPGLEVMGLAPMAVAPEQQRKGVGVELVNAGLLACKQLEFVAAVVLGHPEYYPRFGVSPASRFGIDCEIDAPEGAFMAVELQENALHEKSGTIRYHAAFHNMG